MADEKGYENFVISEHQVVNVAPETPSEQASEAPSAKKLNISLSETEKNQLVKLIIRKLLNQSPFSTKYDDIRHLVKQYTPETTNFQVMNVLIESVKNVLSKIFGLTLEDVKYAQGKRDIFLKQTISFKEHDLKILSEGDHELRGFILFLIPCFKAYNNSILLNVLCDIFNKIGKNHMTPHCKEDEETLILKLKMIKRKKDIKYYSKEFANISDYLLYAKDLQYIYILFDDQSTDLSSVKIIPGYRLNLECNKLNYIDIFKRLDETTFNKGLDVFFE